VKNKKLFAILTLVCFMFTLMPVAAFAAEPTVEYVGVVEESGEKFLAWEVNNPGTNKVVWYNGAAEGGYGELTAVTVNGDELYLVHVDAAADAEDGCAVMLVDGTFDWYGPADSATVKAFELTAAQRTVASAALNAADNETSFVWTKEANAQENLRAGVAKADIVFDILTAAEYDAMEDLYIWVTEGSNKAPSSALTAVSNAAVVKDDQSRVIPGLFFLDNVTSATEATLTFARDGVYTIHAAIVVNATTDFAKAYTDKAAIEVINVLDELATDASYSKVTVDATSVSSSKYVTEVTIASNTYELANGAKLEGKVAVNANSIDKETVKVVVKDNENNVLKREDVKVVTSSDSIAVDYDTLNTGSKGYVEFDVTGSVEGAYWVYVSVGQYEARIEVVVGAIGATYIETIKNVTNMVDLDTASLAGRVEFEITDINGNVVIPKDVNASGFTYADVAGLDGALTNDATEAGGTEKGIYVKFVEKPAKSNLKNEDLTLVYLGEQYGWTISVNGGLDAEGTYEIKVLLDNGKAAYATVNVKEFQTPVRLVLTYKQAAVELGGTAVVDQLIFMDANGVTKSAANEVELAANGYAILDFDAETGAVKVKPAEQYVGKEIKVIAVSERYDLTATATIKVTADAAELQFVDKTAEVGINNKLDIQLVDGAGNKVAPTNMSKAEISYVVLDKPADAKVSVATVSQKDLAAKGTFTMALTSNTVGNVTVQAIAKLTDAAGVVKYYTGAQVIAVGTDSTGDVVVMSIGSNQIVKNDAVATMVAAPVVENNRTFVPFRALAEAFGAEVAWDEATQAVTAELNGVKVVLTIGSANYTVNGVEKAADVAPFINGASTMVPVRFVAEAFGIKVIPTYDANGATADILFNL